VTSCCKGKSRRNRTALVDAQCKELSEGKSCSGNNCPVDCKVGEWTAWSECFFINIDQLCDDCVVSIANRSKSILTHAAYGGSRCPDRLHQNKICESNSSGTLLIGFMSSSVVLLLLLFLTAGCLCYTLKTRHTTKTAVKTDVNPVYEIEDNPELAETYDYMG